MSGPNILSVGNSFILSIRVQFHLLQDDYIHMITVYVYTGVDAEQVMQPCGGASQSDPTHTALPKNQHVSPKHGALKERKEERKEERAKGLSKNKKQKNMFKGGRPVEVR